VTRIVLLAVAAVIIASIAFGAWRVFADRRLPASPVTVEVAPGASTSDITSQLASAGVVSSPRLLGLYLRAQKASSNIQAADYDFPAHLTIPEVARILVAGGRPSQVWITVPEGFTAAQIARRLSHAGLEAGATFLAYARQNDLTIGPWRTQGLEGYLYPNTYLVPRHASASQVGGQMTAEFLRKLPANSVALARHLGFSIPHIVTIASMIEREAKVDSERPIIAAVIYNRLRLGMPLEIDATIEYALPRYKQVLSFHDLAIDSPYNTYKHSGLPPTPIANPGKKSLLAAFHPAKVDYLYYVYRGHGHHEFSRTLEEQQAAERKYLP
jgi:UPF0755 protein